MDSFAVFTTFLVAYVLRFNFELAAFKLQYAINQGLIATAFYALFFMILRSFTRLLRHTTVADIFNLLLSTSFSFIALICLTIVERKFISYELIKLPLSILTIHFMLITLFLFTLRIAVKIIFLLIAGSHDRKKNLLIYGAGAMGVIVKRVIQSDIKAIYRISGFLDSNKRLQGKVMNGFPVYSPDKLNEKFLEKNSIHSLIVAIKDLTPDEKSEIVSKALNLGLEVLDTPPVDSWLDGNLQMSQIKKVELEDLLGRDPIHLNLKRIAIGLYDKVIMVTGAAGSIGSEIVRQLAIFNIKKLILVDQAETPIYNLKNELKANMYRIPVQVILGDVANKEKMERVFREYTPDIVFHAAAYKHVPLMEENPHEAIRVNIGSTLVITELAMKYKVSKFVMISSDKAVNPTNIMGASKRICELIVQSQTKRPENTTQFVITRFGNVLGSNGSVIPMFMQQIDQGGPITVTHPEITRYFMTIPEACQLVLEAGFMGKGGEIYVFDMGKPVKILELARQMIRLAGKVPETEIKIVFTGLRPGEKLYEELLTSNENSLPTHHPKIKIARIEEVKNGYLMQQISFMLQNLYKLTEQDIISQFNELVPEYIYPNHMKKGKFEEIKVKNAS